MRIVFFGTPEVAAEMLEALIKAGHEILCVVTQPDRPKGRGQKLAFPPVKEAALKHVLPLEQPETVKNNPVFKAFLESLVPDIAVIVAYGKILPKELLAIPKHGFINVHASLLPKYRGAAPVQWALLKGEKETGVTVMRVEELLDTGEIIAQEKVKIEDEDNAETLTRKLFSLGKDLLLKVLKQIETGKAKYLPQREGDATYAPSIAKESAEIDWRKPAVEIHNRIRAMIPWPVAHTFCREKILKIWASEVSVFEIEKKGALPGTIVHVLKNEGFVVATGGGYLLVRKVQPEAGKRMKAYDFVIGRGLAKGEVLPG